MRYVTIKDIAAALGISKSTVSRALHGDTSNVGKETLQKIVETARQMGYHRNEAAVNLRAKSNHVIGILVPEITTPFSMSYISEVQKLMNEKGYGVNIAFSNEDPEVEKSNLEIFANGRVDGIMVSSCHNTANLETYRSLLRRRIPLVFFDRVISEGISVPCVTSNDHIKSFFVVEHMIRKGCRRIVHLAGPDHIQNAVLRCKGYREAIAKFKIDYDPELVISSGVDVEDGARAIENFLLRGINFDGVFCFTETQALGAKRCLQEHNIVSPDDVAIATMSGTLLSTLVYPQITAAEQQVGEMARIASELLIEKINDFQSPDRTIIIDAKIVERNSTQKSSVE